MIAFIRPKINANSLVGCEVIHDPFTYRPNHLADLIGYVVEAIDDETCCVQFEVNGKRVLFSIPARDLSPVKRNGGEE